MMQAYSRPVGLGLRHPHYEAVCGTRQPLDVVEVHAENFFVSGGAIVHVLKQAAALYPISLHGVGLGLGNACGLDPWHIAQLKRLCDQFNPMLVSEHVCFGAAVINQQRVHAHDLLPMRYNRASFSLLASHVNRLQDSLQRRIALENISQYVPLSHSDVCETEFLNTLCQHTGCGLLLDINNVYVNAFNQLNTAHHTNNIAQRDALIQTECAAYIYTIQPEHVMELHLAGCTMPQGTALMIDDHATAVHEPVWDLYHLTLQHLANQPCVPTLIEWDVAIPPLATILHEVARASAVVSTACLSR
jgi:uncharacterized protein